MLLEGALAVLVILACCAGVGMGRFERQDGSYVAAVDAEGQPVEKGAPSHAALITNLANTIQPIIRYELGDSITLLAEDCPCGNPLPAIRIEGRREEILPKIRENSGPHHAR